MAQTKGRGLATAGPHRMIGDGMKMQGEMDALRTRLDALGIPHEDREGGMVTFHNSSGECRVFPSQTYDGLLKVRFSGEGRVGTADAALRLCGVLE